MKVYREGFSRKRKISKERVWRMDVIKIQDIVENVFTKPIAVGDEHMPVKQK